MQQHERDALKTAAHIIRKEMMAGRSVKIPGFGKLYLSRVKWTDRDTGTRGTVNTVRFKPFQALKNTIGNRRVEGSIPGRGNNFEPGGEALKHEPSSTVRTGAPVVNIHSAPKR